MSKNVGAPAPFVILPWVTPELTLIGRTATGPATRDAFVATASSDISGRDPGRATPPSSLGGRGARSEGEKLGIPFRPLPLPTDADEPPPEDRVVLSVAVVLDVLGTRTRARGAAPTLLSQVCADLAPVLELDAAPEDDRIAELLAFAASPAGAARSALATKLAMASARAIDEDAEAPLVSTPSGAAAALRRIERLAEVVVSDARGLLEAADTLDYKKA